MDARKLNSKKFLAFCRVVSNKLGQADIEVLYSWYYNTFDVKQETETELKNTNTTVTDEDE